MGQNVGQPPDPHRDPHAKMCGKVYGDIIDCCLEQDLMDVNTGYFVRRIRTAARQSGKGRVNLQEETGEVNERVRGDRFLSG